MLPLAGGEVIQGANSRDGKSPTRNSDPTFRSPQVSCPSSCHCTFHLSSTSLVSRELLGQPNLQQSTLLRKFRMQVLHSVAIASCHYERFLSLQEFSRLQQFCRFSKHGVLNAHPQCPVGGRVASPQNRSMALYKLYECRLCNRPTITRPSV